MNPFSSVDGMLVWRTHNEILWLQPWGRDSLRVRCTQLASMQETAWALLDPPAAAAAITIGEHQAVIRNGAIMAEVTSSGVVTVRKTAGGDVLLQEPAPRFYDRPARHFTSVQGDLWRIEARFEAADGERFYGLGQHKHGFLDQKGCVIALEQRNTEVSIPFLLSSRGYGFLWNNPAIGRVELGRNGTLWVAEASRQLDYWVTTAADYAGILENYTAATGRAPMLPEFASGFWQCKLRYHTQDELLKVARAYKERGLPLSVIVIDYFHWPQFGDWRFNPVEWPDPAGMVRELDAMGVKVMVSVWPSVHRTSVNYAEMSQRGLLVRSERGLAVQSPFSDADKMLLTQYDATNPEARRFIWEQVREGYYRHGIKVWWLDADEPEMYPIAHDNVRYALGNGLEVGCIYPMLHAQAYYEGMRAEGETDIVSLSRSAWAGSQRWGAAVWSGDIPSTFASLSAQVRAGLNIGLSGIPWWTTDIGGFMGGNIDDPVFRELIVRWFQYGAFCPLFRLHGVRTDGSGAREAPNEVWSFGEEAYAILRDLLFLRERLRPYIMEQMRLAHDRGTPPMRPLFFDFPNDAGSAVIEDEFMFGPDLLVAPVLEHGARSRAVYLPAGASWRDAWSGDRLSGGQVVTAAAPLHRIPLYLRGEARLPIAVS